MDRRQRERETKKGDKVEREREKKNSDDMCLKRRKKRLQQKRSAAFLKKISLKNPPKQQTNRRDPFEKRAERFTKTFSLSLSKRKRHKLYRKRRRQQQQQQQQQQQHVVAVVVFGVQTRGRPRRSSRFGGFVDEIVVVVSKRASSSSSSWRGKIVLRLRSRAGSSSSF